MILQTQKQESIQRFFCSIILRYSSKYDLFIQSKAFFLRYVRCNMVPLKLFLKNAITWQTYLGFYLQVLFQISLFHVLCQ